MNIVTWNVNSIIKRLLHVKNFIKKYDPDIILLQELKCTEDFFPLHDLQNMGYHVCLRGQKAYNGVAIISRYPLEQITDVLDSGDDQARYIECEVSVNKMKIRIASVYVPQGRDIDSEFFIYKKNFMDLLFGRFCDVTQSGSLFIAGGDYNVASDAMDVYSPTHLKDSVCFVDSMKKAMRQFESADMHDIFRIMHPNKQVFSWWDYRGNGWHYNKGMRIDYLLLSGAMIDYVEKCCICVDERGKDNASDHAPVMCTVNVDIM